MAKQKAKKHHSRPHGGGVSYARRLVQQRAFDEAAREAEVQRRADMIAWGNEQRMMWLMVCSVADAFGIGPKRMQRDFFPALEALTNELRRMIQEDGETYAFEKLRQKAEQVSGIEIQHFYDPDPAAALKREEVSG